LIRRLAIAVAALLALALAGCGGTDAPPPPVPSTQAFQLQKAWINSLTIPDQKSFSAYGTWTGAQISSGSGTATWGALTAATFEGKPALSATAVSGGSLTQPNYVVVPFSRAPSTLYVDANYVPMGMVVGAMYFVVSSTTPMPASAKVGETGILATFIRYSGGDKASALGTRTVTWALQPDTDTTAILALAKTDYDADNTIIGSDTLSARITTAGGYTRIRERITSTDSTLLDLTLY
jgi:hypothetical protein